jgi:hypothetical protein
MDIVTIKPKDAVTVVCAMPLSEGHGYGCMDE